MCFVFFDLFQPGRSSAQFDGDFEIRRTALADENFLDWRAYQPLLLWRYDWWIARNALRVSAGSISEDQFYLLQEIKLMVDLGPALAFLYSREQESFARAEPAYQEAELRFGGEWSASLLGSVEAEKQFNNIGAAVARGRRSDWDFTRFSWVNQFAQYNRRSTGEAKTEGSYGQTPVFQRLEIRRFWEERLLVSLDAVREAKTRFNDREGHAQREYEGEAWDIQVDGWSAERDWLAGFSWSGDRERREQLPDGSGEGPPHLNQELELHARQIHVHGRVTDRDALTVGLSGNVYSNRIEGISPSERFRFELATTQVFAQWERDPGSEAHGLLSAQAGWVRSRTSGASDGEENRDRRSFQAKAGVGLVLEQPDRHRFLFLTTWDLDSSTGTIWDGGNVQLQVLF